ncbi:MAG: JDVT-CTERM system glutamic-type intramembrane protease [Gammaproteobacteria bacterium]|nr:JDVT-CTERM system glutamic-type intramembrane protease [Gammaproteobacteria bacterium]
MAHNFAISRLLTDRQFWLVVVAGPFFWLSLYSSGTAVTGPDWVSENIMLFLQLALLYPVVEEMVFRGLVQEGLWKTRAGRLSIYCISMPNILTSILFTLFHFFNHSPAWAVAVIFPSLVFGYFRDRYNILIPSIILHIFYNAGYFFLFGN